MKVPFLDVGAAYRELKSEIDSAVSRVLDSGWYVLGPEVEAFESEWADYCEAKWAVGVANGLDALILALRALDIGPGDEVIVPSNTYIATWLAISSVGATPVPVEPDPLTYNISPKLIDEAITPHTRALVPVHLYGQPADLDSILELARVRDLRVIEDAAQAHGAIYKGRRIGAHGDVVCWSFYPGKNLGALGDAGAVTTNSGQIAERVSLLRNYGSREKYVNLETGVNSRLDPMQAAVLRVKLKSLDKWTERRRTIANEYDERLRNTGVILPQVPGCVDPVWHLYVVRSAKRDALQAYLNASEIGTLIHYPIPPHMQRAYEKSRFSKIDLSLTTKLADEVLSLPIGPHLGEKCIDNVINTIIEFFDSE
ncbi:MAG: DegT/DnrJ/EryC1/StrS family aminotransferase [Pseudomonadota bacterium]